MVTQDARRINIYEKLVDKLKSHSDGIEHTEAPIKNSDVLKLLEISKAMSKSEAIQFAVKFTIDNFGQNNITLSPIEAKLEMLRYAKEEAHEASDELLDSVSIIAAESKAVSGNIKGGINDKN